MKKVQKINFVDFCQRNYVNESFIRKAKRHIAQNKSFYITVGGYVVLFLITGIDSSYADSGFDLKAEKMYKKVCGIGKWVIAVKGGFDVMNTITTGDMSALKTKVISYVVAYLSLLGLPWLLDQVEVLFEDGAH
jgi:hypothetical protein